MSEVRDLLAIPEAEIDARLARAMGWVSVERVNHEYPWKTTWFSSAEEIQAPGAIQRGELFTGYYSPPAYCSESSPRSLLGAVEARIDNMESRSRTFSLITASAAIRARAALWVLEERKDG